MKKKVLFSAPVLTVSGYGVHSRQVAKWLFAKAEEMDLDITCDPVPWGSTPWLTDVYAEDGLVGKVMQTVENKKPFYDISIQIKIPNEWTPFVAKYNIGITAGVETDICNPAWISAINKMQLVIVPSEFVKNTFKNTGNVTTRIEVVPEAFPNEMLREDINPTEVLKDLNLTTNFNFLLFGQMTGNNADNDRKNIPYTMKWFMELFSRNKDVGLVIKTNFARVTKLDKMMATNIFKQMLAGLKYNSEIGPKIYLLHGRMTDTETTALYRHPKIKCLLNLGHGEGFGLTNLEAAASGLPVIATNWSAHTEFLNNGEWIKIDYKLDKIHPSRVDNQIFMENAQWSYPSELDAKRKILRFYEKSSKPQEWASDLKIKIQEKYNLEAIHKQYDTLLLDLLK